MSTKHDPAQLDLFVWAQKRPTAKVISAIPGLAKRMWRERHMVQPNNPPSILLLRRRA
ncbi:MULTISPECIES: hypothetical protein [unclassified Mesorhizobium]|uniref:hypothetical protein n=1 Tax=unclassified Mesorhizobium TaxID=325217 RepID=UPI00163D71A8|nr:MULTISPECIES: hypothetical protein [unclassified Mesorhizobium]